MDYHSRYDYRWKSFKVKARASKIHGLGVVATHNIAKGEIVFVYGDVIIPRSAIREYWKKWATWASKLTIISGSAPRLATNSEHKGWSTILAVPTQDLKINSY